MKQILVLIAVVLTSISLQAQQPATGDKNQQGNGRREFSPELYIKSMNEFVTREAKLTEAEAAKFIPMLNEMFAKQHKIAREQRELSMKTWKNQNLNEAEYETIVTKLASLDVENKQLEQTYYKKFHTVLPWKKVFAVRVALSRFQMEALNRFQPGRNGGQQGNRENKWPGGNRPGGNRPGGQQPTKP